MKKSQKGSFSTSVRTAALPVSLPLKWKMEKLMFTGSWMQDRWYGSDGLQKFASSHGRNWEDLALQLAFFKHEAIENYSISAYFPGGFQKYKALTSVEGEGGAAHVFFYAFEYGNYVSYSTFLSDEFERNFATRTKRLAISRSVYNDRSRYP